MTLSTASIMITSSWSVALETLKKFSFLQLKFAFEFNACRVQSSGTNKWILLYSHMVLKVSIKFWDCSRLYTDDLELANLNRWVPSLVKPWEARCFQSCPLQTYLKPPSSGFQVVKVSPKEDNQKLNLQTNFCNMALNIQRLIQV